MTNPHILKLMNFLRDFADANADSFAPEQIDYLNQAAVAIVILDEAVDKLVKERDSARWEVCELSGNGSIDSAMRVAEERGWNLTEEDSDAEANP